MLSSAMSRTGSHRLVVGGVLSLIAHLLLALLVPALPVRIEQDQDFPLYIALTELPAPVLEEPVELPEPLLPEPSQLTGDSESSVGAAHVFSEPTPDAPGASDAPGAHSAPGAPDTSVASAPTLPPRSRTTDAAALRAETTDGIIPVDARQEVAQFYRWVSEREQQLSEYVARQQRREDATGPRDQSEPGQTDSELQVALQEFIRNITRQSENVVTASPSRAAAPESASPGDNRGITVTGPGGPRRRTFGAPPSLEGINLPPGFPPAYAVHVIFRVSPQGQVVRTAVVPPTPYPELDRRIVTAVDQWRFEPASGDGSSFIEGSVTILIDTSMR